MAETYLGTIVATTTQNNADTATPFAVPTGAKLSIQPDVACYVRVGSSSTLTVTSSNGVLVEANALFPTSTQTEWSAAYVSVLPVSGTVNAKVFERYGTEG